MDKQISQADPDSRPQAGNADCVDLARRGFVRRSGKALYIAPALLLLGSAKVSAAGSGCAPGLPGCPPDANPAPAAPAAPAPTE